MPFSLSSSGRPSASGMSCPVKSSTVTLAGRPSAGAVIDPRPEGDGICRTFDVTTPDVATFMVTFVDFNPMVTFAGDAMTTFDA